MAAAAGADRTSGDLTGDPRVRSVRLSAASRADTSRPLALGYPATLIVAPPIGVPDSLSLLARGGSIIATAATIVAYFVVMGSTFFTLSVVTNLAELVLVPSVILETAHAWNARSADRGVDRLRRATA